MSSRNGIELKSRNQSNAFVHDYNTHNDLVKTIDFESESLQYNSKIANSPSKFKTGVCIASRDQSPESNQNHVIQSVISENSQEDGKQ